MDVETIARKLEDERLMPSVERFSKGEHDDHDIVPAVIWTFITQMKASKSQMEDLKSQMEASKSQMEDLKSQMEVLKTEHKDTTKKLYQAVSQSLNNAQGTTITAINNVNIASEVHHKKEGKHLLILTVLVSLNVIFALALLAKTFIGS